MSDSRNGVGLPDDLRILVLDDNQGFLDVLDQFFSECGYSRFLCATIEEARQSLESEAVDVALIDYSLSRGETSTELFHEIRRRWPRIKVFLVSGFLQFHELNDFLRDKLTDQILLKPFSLEQLKMALASAFCADEVKLPPTDPGQATVPR